MAPINADLKTAPGQVSARDLRSIYRIEQVDAATRVYGVAGDPIEHSLSPVIMNTALRRENVNGVYLPLHAKTLKDLIHCVREIPLHGLSITMPYKQAILRLSRQHRRAHREDRRLQHGRPRTGRQALRLQYRHRGRASSAGAAPHD